MSANGEGKEMSIGQFMLSIGALVLALPALIGA